ncbi:helix-turn-helix transcriptional regulator [Streptomyces sp. NPDC085460]|uniref:helix-turn-helix transcriptional regulator n=1 Tax=unclassified Streptomyces TaxID=2593676 RepID=UPI0037D188E2
MVPRPLAGLSEISEYTGLPEKSIYHQVHAGTGVGALAFKVGRYLKWDWDDVEKWVTAQKSHATAA